MGNDMIEKRSKTDYDQIKKISWMPLIVIASVAFIGALDATFMNVSTSQVVRLRVRVDFYRPCADPVSKDQRLS